MQSNNRYKKFVSTKIYCRFINRIIVLVLISILSVETISQQGLFISGNHMAFADEVKNTGTQMERE